MRNSSKRKPLKLAYVVDTLVTGGAERLVVTFAKETMTRPDLELTVFVLSKGGTPFSEELEELGIEVVYLPGKSLIDIRRFTKLVSELRKRSFDFVHAHLISSTVLGGWAAAILRLPFATTIHNVKASTARVSKLRGNLYRSVLRMPGTVRIAVGQAVAEAAKADTGGRNCMVIQNAVSPEAIATNAARNRMRTKLGVADRKVLIAVGAIIGQKAYGDLIVAFSDVVKMFPNTILLIAGNAPDTNRFEKLQKQVEDRGLSEQVQFLGLRSDIPDLLAAADLFVSASHWEGLPVSVLEAMINGVPCVVTDVGDNALILDGTGAPIVPPGQPEKLAVSLLEMLKNDPVRKQIGQAARCHAVEHYGTGAWVDKLTEVYASSPRRPLLLGLNKRRSAPGLAAGSGDRG